MIDFAKITVKAGDGGSGSGSFMHLKGKRRGKADGGDGGVGGSVYLVASADLNTLEPFRFIKHYEAKRGQDGASNKRTGAQGADLEVRVPTGTLVTADSSSFDLLEKGQKVLVARGGQGGRGNTHLRDEFGRRPRTGETGETGEDKELVLELKLIADVGLIGLPNAGKSTLLSAISSARPKVADYPFTTLEPNLGVVNNLKLVVADIPGLIEGASEGKGLGDLFLRHIERTKILVHLIDVSHEGDLLKNYRTIREELKNYSKDLSKKKEIVVLSKIDLATSEKVQETVKQFKAKRKKVLAISAKTGEGIPELVKSFIKEAGLYSLAERRGLLVQG